MVCGGGGGKNKTEDNKQGADEGNRWKMRGWWWLWEEGCSLGVVADKNWGIERGLRWFRAGKEMAPVLHRSKSCLSTTSCLLSTSHQPEGDKQAHCFIGNRCYKWQRGNREDPNQRRGISRMVVFKMNEWINESKLLLLVLNEFLVYKKSTEGSLNSVADTLEKSYQNLLQSVFLWSLERISSICNRLPSDGEIAVKLQINLCKI